MSHTVKMNCGDYLLHEELSGVYFIVEEEMHDEEAIIRPHTTELDGIDFNVSKGRNMYITFGHYSENSKGQPIFKVDINGPHAFVEEKYSTMDYTRMFDAFEDAIEEGKLQPLYRHKTTLYKDYDRINRDKTKDRVEDIFNILDRDWKYELTIEEVMN